MNEQKVEQARVNLIRNDQNIRRELEPLNLEERLQVIIELLEQKLFKKAARVGKCVFDSLE